MRVILGVVVDLAAELFFLFVGRNTYNGDTISKDL